MYSTSIYFFSKTLDIQISTTVREKLSKKKNNRKLETFILLNQYDS